jgi:hypothetical protein
VVQNAASIWLRVTCWQGITQQRIFKPVPDTSPRHCPSLSPKEPLLSPTVLILCYHFFPSNEIGARRVTALATFLAGFGVRVFVVSAFDDQVAYGSEILPGIVAIPVARSNRPLLKLLVAAKQRLLNKQESRATSTNSKTPGKGESLSFFGHTRKIFFRAAYFIDSHKAWSRRAARAAKETGRSHKLSLLFASGPPHSALIAGAFAASVLKIPYVADFRDPWSDALAAADRTRAFELSLLRRLETAVVNAAAVITSTSELTANLLISRNPRIRDKVRIIRNGYDGAVAASRTSTDRRLAILFAGELYIGRNPFPFLNALERLTIHPGVQLDRISVTFMGKCESYDGKLLVDWAADKNCAAVVKVLGPQPPNAVAAAVSDATVLLNIAQGQQLSIPAKTYEHLAMGREVLLLCEDDCETARIVSGIPGVNQVDPSHCVALEQVLWSLYKRHVLENQLIAPAEADVQRFSRLAANQVFMEAFRSVAPDMQAPITKRG